MSDNINREGWHFEHITKPNDPWYLAGKERTRAPVTDTELRRDSNHYQPAKTTNRLSEHYDYIYQNYGGTWYFKFSVDGKRHRRGKFPDEHYAARAYNAYIKRKKLDREPLDIIEDVEDKSA